MQTNTKEMIQNSQVADSSSKIIFEDNILCSQFLRDYIELPYFNNIQPEDIEDVSEQYVSLFAEERNADRVKKVNIKNEIPFFMISLIEHKSRVDYNVSMQIFRYMIYIWEKYAKEAEKMQKGITKRADFKSRIIEGDTFGKYIPNFEYYLVPLRRYSNEDLLSKKDEISLVMLINRMRNEEDVEAFRKLPAEKVEEILKETPEHLLDIISNVLRAFLLKMNLPEEETEELVGKVKEKKMGYLFEDMTLDIQAIRREAAEERQKVFEERQKTVETKENGLRVFIEGYQEVNVSKELTHKKIVEKFGLTESEASEKMKLYWKE